MSSNGAINIYGPGASDLQFEPSLSSGGYIASPGDHDVLTASGTNYVLTAPDGTETVYNVNGSLDYVEDADGNRTTAGYTGNELTSLVDSTGQSLTLTYNAAGLVSTITDSDGRATTYHYDSTNQYLASVVDFDGHTTSYTYNTGTKAVAAHALLTVTNPDGSHDYFTYDSLGRLSSIAQDNGVNGETFAYSEGRVDMTDAALGGTTSYYFDEQGLLLKAQNARAGQRCQLRV